MKRRERLTNMQFTELQQMIKSKKSDVVEMRRAQAVLLVNQSTDEFTIKSVTGFDKKVAFKLKRRYQEKGLAGIETKKKKTRPLFTKNQLKELTITLQTKAPNECGINAEFWTASILAEYIKKEYNVIYKSKTSYYLIFKKADFSYRKPEKQYHARNQEGIDAWRKEKLPDIQKAISDPGVVVLAGDEMILTTQTTTQKVWLPMSKDVRVETSNKRDKRCIYGFLDAKTGQQHAFKTDYTNSLTTCDVLKKLIFSYPDKLITIVWDNASWHKSAVVRAFLTAHPGKFHLIPFPPYAPEENPQEHVWKAGRAMVTHNKFIENIDAAADEFVHYLNSTKFEYKFGA